LKRLIPYLALLIFSSGCVNDLKKVEALNERGPGVEVAKQIKTYYYGANGNLKGVLTAPVLYRYVQDTPHMLLDSGLRVDFYNDSMQVQSVLTAKKGEYFENTNNISVRDSVKVVSMGGKRILRTQVLYWDPKKQQFYTNVPATMTTPTQTILAARGLIAPADLSWYKFMQASGELQMDTGYFSPAPRDTASMTAPPEPRRAPVSPVPKDTVKVKDTTTQRPGT
jgi:LPS export ABC transporter protein LptC